MPSNRLSCSGYPVLAGLFWLFLFAILFQLSCSGCSVLAVQFWLSWFLHGILCGKSNRIGRMSDNGYQPKFNPRSNIMSDFASFGPTSKVLISGQVRSRSSQMSDWVPTCGYNTCWWKTHRPEISDQVRLATLAAEALKIESYIRGAMKTGHLWFCSYMPNLT